MTAIRNFPNAPLARRPVGRPWFAPLREFGQVIWQGLHRVGSLHAAVELAKLADYRARRDPVLARQLRAAAEACRRSANQAQSQGQRRNP
ncbi:MAG: hypothetical protein KF720_08345 [Rubrivivax sp.]|nr:hypothetical protein [Rubrivivax sp.]